MRKFIVGDTVKCTQDILGNGVDAIGIVYRTFFVDDMEGISVLLENGQFDDFTQSEQERYFRRVGHESTLAHYEFVNSTKLLSDYHDGTFDKVFE